MYGHVWRERESFVSNSAKFDNIGHPQIVFTILSMVFSSENLISILNDSLKTNCQVIKILFVGDVI